MEQQKNATTVQPLHFLRAVENVTLKTLVRRLAGAWSWSRGRDVCDASPAVRVREAYSDLVEWRADVYCVLNLFDLILCTSVTHVDENTSKFV